MNQKYYYLSLMKAGIFYCVLFNVLKTKLESTKAKLAASNFTGLTQDDIFGDLLYTTALSYHAELGVMNQVTAKTMGLVAITYPSETMFSYELKSKYYYGIPVSVSPSGLAMDADRLITLVKSLDGDTEKPKQFMLSAGMKGSALEHSVPEHLWSTPDNPAQGISAVKALQIANAQGIPIYSINKENINTILPQLQIDYDDKTDIKNAVSAGKEVTVSKTNITFNGWTGVGYIVIDPKTGAGGYMISGGMSGAFVMIKEGLKMMIMGLWFLYGPGWDMISDGFNLYVAGMSLIIDGYIDFYSNPEVQDALKFICVIAETIVGGVVNGDLPALTLLLTAGVLLILLSIYFALNLLECEDF